MNDQTVTLGEFRQRVEGLLKDVGSLTDEEKAKFVQDLYDQIKIELLFLERAEEKEVDITSGDLERAKKRLMEQNGFTTEEELLKALEKTGMTLSDLEEKLTRDLKIERILYGEVYTQSDITQWELEQFYKTLEAEYRQPQTYHLREITLYKEKHTNLNEIIHTLNNALKAGISFEELAKAYSDSPSSLKGGDVGKVALEDLKSPVQEAVKTLKEGEVAGPIDLGEALQFIQLVKINPPYLPPLEEVKQEVLERYLKVKYKDNLDNFVQELQNRYFVLEHKELLKDVFPHH